MIALKWCRVVVATLVFAAVVALFLDFTKTVPRDLHWLLHLQVTQMILGGSFVGLLILLLTTFLLGRVYCSCLCPFGIMQDMIARIGRLFRGKKKKHYLFRKEMKKTRYSFLAIFAVGLIAMIFTPVAAVVTLLDSYSNFGRIMNALACSLWIKGNDFLVQFAPDRFYYEGVYMTLASFLTAIAVLLPVGFLAFFFGRRYCNTICPVGTLLGLVAKFSPIKVRLKADCISCGLCEKSCKGECIDSKNKTVDSSRCVACFNCLSTCRRGSIVYALPLAPTLPQTVQNQNPPVTSESSDIPATDSSRRRFLQGTAFSFLLPSFITSLGAARGNSPPPDSSLPSGVSRIGYEMTIPILPPGAISRKHYQSRCTGCHLCVTKCPANIIVPSTLELGIGGFMQPILKFDHGFCGYDCTICTEVCPSRALQKIETKEEKHLIQFGRVYFLKDNCVVETSGTNCGACAEHCPTGAVTMVPVEGSTTLTIPVTDPDLCIGCGACEYICPVRPYRAIYVEGIDVHAQAKPAYDPDAKQEEAKLEEFWF